MHFAFCLGVMLHFAYVPFSVEAASSGGAQQYCEIPEFYDMKGKIV